MRARVGWIVVGFAALVACEVGDAGGPASTPTVDGGTATVSPPAASGTSSPAPSASPPSGGTTSPPAPSGDADGGTAPPSCATAAPPKAGMLFWLKAGVGVTTEGTRVTGWADQAGGTPAVPPSVDQRPTLVPNALNGKPVLHFEGGREALQRNVPIEGLHGLTIAFVNATPTLWKDDPNEWCHHAGCDPNGPAGVRVISETGCSGTYEHVLWWNGTGDWTGVYLSPKQEEIAFRFGNGVETYSKEPCSLVHDPWVAWPRPQSIGKDFSFTVAVHDELENRLYVHGKQVSNTPVAGGKDGVVHAGDRLDIGNGFGWVELTNHGGDVAEVLVYGRALPDAERQALETYAECNLFGGMPGGTP